MPTSGSAFTSASVLQAMRQPLAGGAFQPGTLDLGENFRWGAWRRG